MPAKSALPSPTNLHSSMATKLNAIDAVKHAESNKTKKKAVK